MTNRKQTITAVLSIIAAICVIIAIFLLLKRDKVIDGDPSSSDKGATDVQTVSSPEESNAPDDTTSPGSPYESEGAAQTTGNNAVATSGNGGNAGTSSSPETNSPSTGGSGSASTTQPSAGTQKPDNSTTTAPATESSPAQSGEWSKDHL